VTGWTELSTEIVDRRTYERAIRHLRAARVVLPTFAQLADPRKISASLSARLHAFDCRLVILAFGDRSLETRNFSLARSLMKSGTRR